MLAVANDLKEIVREFRLDASKVRELNKLSAEKLNLDAVAAAKVRSQANTVRISSTVDIVCKKQM
jgi:hypothetical protein